MVKSWYSSLTGRQLGPKAGEVRGGAAVEGMGWEPLQVARGSVWNQRSMEKLKTPRHLYAKNGGKI